MRALALLLAVPLLGPILMDGTARADEPAASAPAASVTVAEIGWMAGT